MLGTPALHDTPLGLDELAHLRRLVASWQSLADLCFSDLLLLTPIDGPVPGEGERGDVPGREHGHRFVVLGQVRPTTGQTLYPADMVGTVVGEVERPLLSHAWRQGEILVGGGTVLGSKERARVQCIPVRHRDALIALVTRESPTESPRRHGELERNYLAVFDRLATMVAEGSFPFGRDEVPYEDTPRVSDGVIVLDGDRRILFASPNAVSSLHRMGIHAYTKGMRLDEIGFDQEAVDTAIRARLPVDEEMERGDASFTLRTIPLLESDKLVGAVVLLRDVTDLRSRDRMLVSKDATIREIHHRVKNNLQTIAALLRLQGRRLASTEAQEAIDESQRRIRSIAIVHETLSRDAGDVVAFDEVIRPLLRVVEETVSTPDVRIEFDVEGDAGDLRGEVATPLAVVLNELMQNAVDHAFPRDGDGPTKGRVLVRLTRLDGQLDVDVIDDGVGLPPGFDLDTSKGLGLSIVLALMTGELGGSLDLGPADPDGATTGTRAHLRVSLAPSTPVDL
ncbi:MAG TPA: histidine kinase N-terminal domain-containing protein [Acidimicrobiia bacterium]